MFLCCFNFYFIVTTKRLHLVDIMCLRFTTDNANKRNSLHKIIIVKIYFYFLVAEIQLKNLKYLGLIFLIYCTVLLNILRKHLEIMFWYRSAQTLPSLPHQGCGTLRKYGWHCLLASRGKTWRQSSVLRT